MPIVNCLNNREIGSPEKSSFISNFFDEDYLVDNLVNTEVLAGHSGCVNTLKWNSSGSLLASGSDDRTIRIWKGGTTIHEIETNHMGNVFAVEFLPAKHDEVIVSGAADHMVMMHHIEEGQYAHWQTDGRVKRMFTCQADPYLFWAASEDGILREFDSRTERVNKLLTFENCALKSAAISDGKPYLIAIGMERGEVPIYDRRKPDAPVIKLYPLDPTVASVYTTHVAFNRAGTECIVNQGGGGVLVYELNDTQSPQVLADLDKVLKMSNGHPVAPIEISADFYTDVRKIGSEYIQGKMYHKAIDYYAHLQKRREFREATLRSIFYSNRGLAFLARRERGDSYACIRECIEALNIHPGNKKALWRLSKAFIALEQWDLASTCITEYTVRFPTCNTILKLQNEVANADEHHRPEEMKKREGCIDYKERYTGHMNNQTDIKEANFFGSREQYIVAGSDCGSMHIYSRDTNSLIGIWKTDCHVTNIVQPHPDQFMLATSGIDDEIRLWTPREPEGTPRPSDDSDDDDDFHEMARFARVADPYKFMVQKKVNNVTRMQLNMVAHSVLRHNPDCLAS